MGNNKQRICKNKTKHPNPSVVLRVICGKWGRKIFRPYTTSTIVFGHLSFGCFCRSWIQNEYDKLVLTTYKYLYRVVLGLL